MFWLVTCFSVVLVSLFAKWAASTAIGRLRQSLLHRQREALELKGVLSDLRQEHQQAIRLTREKAADIKRLKSQLAQMEGQARELTDRKTEKRGPKGSKSR